MKKYKFFNIFYLWIFSKDFYIDLIKNWKGTCFGYLFVLILLLSIPGTVKQQKEADSFYKKEIIKLISSVPEIDIKDGIVNIDIKQPYIFSDPDTGIESAIFDTTGMYNNLDDCPGTVQILLTKNKFYYKNNTYEKREFDLSSIKDFKINKDIIGKWAKTIFQFLFLITYPFVVLFSFIYRILTVLLYALIGLIIAKIMKVDIKYDALIRITSVAVTPALIFLLIRDMTVLSVRGYLSLLIFSVLTIGYICFALISYKSDSNKIIDQNKQTMING